MARPFFLQSVASQVWVFQAFLDSDHLTPATGKTIAVTISKNAGAFGNPSGGATNATEISSGWYYWTPSTTDVGTVGPIIMRGTNADIDDVGQDSLVVKATNLGMTGIPDAAADAAGGLPISDAGGLDLDTQLATLTNGTYGLAALEALVDDIGAAGAGLTAIPWNAAWDAEVQSEVADALTAYDTPTATALAALIDALPTAAENATQLLDVAAGVETNRTVRQALRLILAAMAGKSSGLDTTEATYRDTNDTVNRIVATVDADGNRTAVTLDAS